MMCYQLIKLLRLIPSYQGLSIKFVPQIAIHRVRDAYLVRTRPI